MRTVRCSGLLSCHARPPPDRMTDASENVTFPQLLLRTVINMLIDRKSAELYQTPSTFSPQKVLSAVIFKILLSALKFYCILHTGQIN